MHIITYKHIKYQNSHTKTVQIKITKTIIKKTDKKTKITISNQPTSIPTPLKLISTPQHENKFYVHLTINKPKISKKQIKIPLTIYHPKIIEIPKPITLPNTIPKDDPYNIELLFENNMLTTNIPNHI